MNRNTSALHLQDVCICVFGYMGGDWGLRFLTLQNQEVTESHTHVQTHINTSMLNQSVTNDFHMVMFLSKTN